MSKPRDFYPHYVACYTLLIQDSTVLLLRRKNTGYKDNQLCLPAGHKEAGESPRQAAARETLEEVGIIVQLQDLQLAHVGHRIEDREYVDFFFLATNWSGVPINAEPQKCSGIAWYALEVLPNDVMDYTAAAIQHVHNKVLFSER